jgi:hypothetical protein
MNRLQEELLQSGFICPAVKSVCAANRFCWMKPVSEPELAQTLLSRQVGAVLTFHAPVAYRHAHPCTAKCQRSMV